MKAIRQISAILIAVTVFFASCKEALASIPSPPYALPMIGTLQKVCDSEARNVNSISLFAWAHGTNGNFISIGGSSYSPPINTLPAKR